MTNAKPPVDAQIYLEMSRDETHGGGSWGFSSCVWAPAQKLRGGSWPFWTKILRVRRGDTVLHLRGQPPHSSFVDYSTAVSEGYKTRERPPEPARWGYSEEFLRADLCEYRPFGQPILLGHIFHERSEELREYLIQKALRNTYGENHFFVLQSGRLQCLNGAYFSDLDSSLLEALFGLQESGLADNKVVTSVETRSQLSLIYSRVGQARFAQEIFRLYGNRCCFPGCSISDTRFLRASHIARWSDNVELRGHLGNGLCLCLTHDRAFEIGIFYIDSTLKIRVNPKERTPQLQEIHALLLADGQLLRLGAIPPLAECLEEHRRRIGIGR